MTLVAACQWLPSLLAMQQSLRTLHWQLLPHWQLLGSDSDSDSELESSESDLPRGGRGPRAAHRARPPPFQLTPSPAAESQFARGSRLTRFWGPWRRPLTRSYGAATATAHRRHHRATAESAAPVPPTGFTPKFTVRWRPRSWPATWALR